MARKERPLTQRQNEALLDAEDTLFGDVVMSEGWGRSVRGLVNRGLVDLIGGRPYLTEAGKAEKDRIHGHR